MGETSDADRLAWLLARWEELYDVLGLEGPVRHPVDATEQVRIRLADAEETETALDAARRELGEVRAMVEEHRQAAKAANFKAWTAYNDGAEDALNRLADALEAMKGTT